jgi:hypothetical protein
MLLPLVIRVGVTVLLSMARKTGSFSMAERPKTSFEKRIKKGLPLKTEALSHNLFLGG